MQQPEVEQKQSVSDDQPNRPVDCKGLKISAFDIVRLVDLPKYITDDADTPTLVEFYQNCKGRCGLVKYARRPDRDGWRRWYGPNGLILVEITTICSRGAQRCEFVVPPSCVERLPFNTIIMTLFADLDWHVHWKNIRFSDGVDTQQWNAKPAEPISFPVSEGTRQYEIIRSILDTPYSVLLEAHDAAAKVMQSLKE